MAFIRINNKLQQVEDSNLHLFLENKSAWPYRCIQTCNYMAMLLDRTGLEKKEREKKSGCLEREEPVGIFSFGFYRRV